MMQNEVSSSGPTQFERNWAMLAHLTVLLTLVAAMYSGGAGAVVALLVPLGMYLYFGGRSRYVAFQALQATVFQAVGGILCVVVAGAAGLAIAGAWVLTGLLSVVLIGLLLMPLAVALTLVGVLQVLALPVAGLAFALRGAYLTYRGQDFEYPLVGALVGRTMQPAPDRRAEGISL